MACLSEVNLSNLGICISVLLGTPKYVNESSLFFLTKKLV